MKLIILQTIAYIFFTTQIFAGSFPVQNYGNDFMNGFNQSQQFIQRQQQMEDAARNREYQQRILKIEEQRLENERIIIENQKRQADVDEKLKLAQWQIAAISFIADHPEYKEDEIRLNALKAELKTLKGEKTDTHDSKISLLNKAHNQLKRKEDAPISAPYAGPPAASLPIEADRPVILIPEGYVFEKTVVQ